MKSGKSITWGLNNGKLEKEFRSQSEDCKKRNIKYKLIVVVSEPERKQSLDAKKPQGIKTVTSVFLFPILTRPSDMAGNKTLMGSMLKRISASRFSGYAAHQDIVEAFYCAWVEHTPDADGFCVLADVVASIRAKNVCAIRHAWQDSSGKWRIVNNSLLQIKGLEFWTDNGHFEWRHVQMGMQGIIREPCESDGFARFMDRVIAHPPTTLYEFERLLP